jgi:branched-chain amino acid transport system ATP-binding protein
MILNATGITVRFGAVTAVDDVDLRVGDELVGIVGPNGSGKTTLLNALCGVVPAVGKLQVDEREVPLANPRRSCLAGIARVFQAPQTFTGLSCLENVLLGSDDRRWRGMTGAWLNRPGMVRHERARWAQAHDLLDLVGLGPFAAEPAESLTYGQQRLLELARAAMARPRLVLLDEPSAGLNDAETAGLAELLRQLRMDGPPMVLIDHKVDFLDGLCDRIVVLELGSVIAEGRPTEIWTNDRVRRAYLGVGPDA